MKVIFKHVIRLIKIILATAIILQLSGCSMNTSGLSEPKEVEESAETFSSRERTPLDDFLEYMPEAEVYQYLLCDMDNDGEDDYVILFPENNTIRTCTAGLSVCLTDSLYSAIDLGGETGFLFDSKASVTYNCGIPVISLVLRDTESGAQYLYSIEFTMNDETKEANYKIDSKALD